MSNSSADKTTEIFRDAPIPVAVFKNIIPTVVSMLMVMIYNLADTFFIGQTHDALMVAAISIASPAFFLFMAIGNLFGIGGTSLISRSLGAGEKEKAKHISSFCFWSCVVIGVISAIIIISFSEPILMAIGASDATLAYAKEYLDIVALSIPFLIIGNAFSNIIRAEGRPQTAMFGTVFGNLVNIVLDPILISGCGMDVRGAALATLAGNIVAAGIYVGHLSSKKTILSINPKNYMVGNGVLTGVFAIGIPAAFNSVLMTVANVVSNSLMAKYDDLAVAGLGVAAKVNSIVVMVLLGVGMGVQPLLGYCFGAKNKKRFMGVLKFTSIFAFIMSVILTIICYSAADPLVHAFLTDEKAFAYGFRFCRIYIYAGPVLGFMFVFMNAIQSTGAAIPATVLSLLRQGVILIPLYFIFDAVFQSANMLMIAVPVADYSSTLISAILLFFTLKKYFKKFDEPVRAD